MTLVLKIFLFLVKHAILLTGRGLKLSFLYTVSLFTLFTQCETAGMYFP